MSLVIAMYVREGIVMASDSRLTLNSTQQQDGQPILQLSVGQSDSNYKLFYAPNDIGILTHGQADIEGVPIAGYIESFIHEYLSNDELQVDEVPPLLIKYFKEVGKELDAGFYIAGYKIEDQKQIQHVWHVNLIGCEISRINKSNEKGAAWGGEQDILTRLIMPLWSRSSDDDYAQLPTFDIPWQFFTLQDAIDFAVFAIRTTIDSMRFQTRPKTVGGPIDVLVIKPNEAFWVQKKELHV